VRTSEGAFFTRDQDPLFAHVEEVLLPHLLRVVQKDNALMAEVQLFPGINVEPLWNGTDEEWKLVHMALLVKKVLCVQKGKNMWLRMGMWWSLRYKKKNPPKPKF
jgi:hypothetical protein